MTWEEYLTHFNLFSDWNGWNADDKAEALLMALKGDAADLVYGLPECRRLSFEQLGIVLRSRFGAGVNIAADKKKLKDRRKLKEESWNQMGQDIAKLARRIYITAPDVAESEAKDAFIRALPEDLKLVVAAGNPPTLRDCIDNVTQLCSVMNREDKAVRIRFAEEIPSEVLFSSKQQNSSDNSSEVYPNKEGYQGPRRSYSPSPRRNWNNRDPRELKCYFCDEIGHMLRYCPKLVGQPRCTLCKGFGHTIDKCVSFSLLPNKQVEPIGPDRSGNGNETQ